MLPQKGQQYSGFGTTSALSQSVTDSNMWNKFFDVDTTTACWSSSPLENPGAVSAAVKRLMNWRAIWEPLTGQEPIKLDFEKLLWKLSMWRSWATQGRLQNRKVFGRLWCTFGQLSPYWMWSNVRLGVPGGGHTFLSKISDVSISINAGERKPLYLIGSQQ